MLLFLIIEGAILAALFYLITLLAWKEVKYHRHNGRKM
jgi:hypothetical protein